MSLKNPKFGEVFETKRGGRIMYVGPSVDRAWPRDWTGVTIRQAANGSLILGEVAQRVPLDGDWARAAGWRQVEDAS